MGLELIIFFVLLILGIFIFVGFMAKRQKNDPDSQKSSIKAKNKAYKKK
jgi:hypothetical protein